MSSTKCIFEWNQIKQIFQINPIEIPKITNYIIPQNYSAWIPSCKSINISIFHSNDQTVLLLNTEGVGLKSIQILKCLKQSSSVQYILICCSTTHVHTGFPALMFALQFLCLSKCSINTMHQHFQTEINKLSFFAVLR